MSLKKYSHEEVAKMPMIDLAHLILLDKKKALDFRDIFAKIAELKKFNKKQEQDKIAQFYTDMNIDGRFMTTGTNFWGLKRWYPVDQMDEELNLVPKKKKKTKKKKAVKKEKEQDVEETESPDDNIEVLTNDFKKIVDGDDEDEEDDVESFDENDEEDEYSGDEDEEEYEDEDEDSDKKKK